MKKRAIELNKEECIKPGALSYHTATRQMISKNICCIKGFAAKSQKKKTRKQIKVMAASRQSSSLGGE